MLNLVKIFTFLFFIVLTAQAQAYLELNAFYNSDNFKNEKTNSNTVMLYDASIGFAIDKKGMYSVGWNYSGNTASTNDGTNSKSYSSTQMGPRFIFFFDKAKMFNLGLTYNISTKASYNDGTDTFNWKGTAMKADFGVNFPIGETSFFGLRLNYSTASYNEQLKGSADYKTVSYNRNFIYPSLSMFFGF